MAGRMAERGLAMRLVVDLTRCQGYGQCAFLAPDVFQMRGAEALWDNPEPDDAQQERVLRAAAACPVQAIRVDRIDATDQAAAMVSGSAAAAARSKPTPPRPVPPQRAGEPAVGGWRAATIEAFRRSGRIVIVGASLAGLAAAAYLRREGFAGSVTVIGDEPDPPYDRPPLSKEVLHGWIEPDHVGLPLRDETDAQWRLGIPATGLDVIGKRVLLADESAVEYDRVLIATGTRARPWHNQAEAALDGVFTLRTSADAAALRQRLARSPRRVLVIGAGFTGSEIASACRDQDLAVTVAERGSAPLVGALGEVVGGVAAGLQRAHGVDLRCGVTVTSLDGDSRGRLRQAQLSDGTTIDTDVAVAALGAIRNTEWLRDSGLAVGVWGVACDAGCRAFDVNAITTEDIFVAGDVARFPHPLYEYQFLALEHWGNAVTQAEVAAHNMVSLPEDHWPHLATPVFWSQQFGMNIKSVGVPTVADQVVVAQGSVPERRFVAAYGYRGRMTAAVSFDHGMWLDFYQKMIEAAAPFPPTFPEVDEPAYRQPLPAQIDQRQSFHATVALTGHDPSERQAEIIHVG
jgi:NADPH-dependent 2,4-dienoyl-CoA reductase/sulfur reductase-like enzyme/ferredoxin